MIFFSKDNQLTVLQKYSSLNPSFAEEELQALASILSHRRYQVGDAVIVENSPADKIFFLEKGSLEITKTVDGQLYSLGSLQGRKIFGELAHLTAQKRSCTLTALDNVEVWVARQADFTHLPPQFHYLHDKLSLYIAIDSLEHNYHKMTDEIIIRNKFGKFFLAVILGFCLFIAFLECYDQLLHYASSSTIGMVSFSIGSLLCLYIIRSLHQPFSSFGITCKKWQSSLVEGLIISALLVALAYLIFPDIDFLQNIFSYLPYLLFISFLQEFIFRGVSLTAFEQFYRNRGGAVLLSSCLFAILHLQFGLPIFFFSFLSGIFLGMLYLRHRSLLGITVLHTCLGILARATGVV